MIHIFLVLILIKSDFIDRAKNRLGMGPAAQAEAGAHFNRMVSYHKRMDGNILNGSTIFIGDSIIQGLCVSAVTSPSVNYGIGSDTTSGILQRIPYYNSLSRARVIVVAVGINDLMVATETDIIDNYKAILKILPANVPVLFSAVLPVAKNAPAALGSHSNRQIKSLNSRLKAFTDESSRTFFLDAGLLLVDEDGYLSDKFHIGDGVHLNTEGYNTWIIELRNTLNKIPN